MKRKSSSEEEKARDVLYEFVLSRDRAPLRILLTLYFAEGLLLNSDVQRLLVQSEVPTNLGSRADLVVASTTHLLFVEVKIDAVEQVGQYEKYKHFFESQGYIVTAGGLVERTRSARTKDNAAFLKELGVCRLTWSEVISAFQENFGETDEFRRFADSLRKIRPTLGLERWNVEEPRASVNKNSALIAADNSVLATFYNDLLKLLSPMEGKLWQYGNSPYCLAFGNASWAATFRENWFFRAFICCQKKMPSEPAFGFSVMLWNRTWTKDKVWFEQHKSDIAQYFSGRGFDVGRNVGSSWHRRKAWLPPYDTKGLKYANAAWSPLIPLRSGDRPSGWNELLSVSADKCKELARIIDGFAGK